MKKIKKDEDNAVDKTEDSVVEDIIKSSAELEDQNECLNFSKNGGKKMDLEMDREMVKDVNGLFINRLRQILQAMDAEIIFDDGEGSFSVLDDLCRIEVDYEISNSVDITFARNIKPWAVAEFAMRFVKITDLLNISVFVWEDHEQGSIFNGKDVYSGKDIENVE